MKLPALALGIAFLAACAAANPEATSAPTERTGPSASAVFAGGCFWCMEADFEKLDGVYAAVSGYAGGSTQNPSYKKISGGQTGHAEVVRVDYNPELVSYQQLLTHFWRNVDPTTPNRQFCDGGSQYRAALMPLDETQAAAARESLKKIVDSGRFETVHVSIENPGTFWPAEDYHQDYYRKNPVRYKWYRSGCGRDARLDEIWQ